MRFALKFAGVVLLTAALSWLGLATGRGAGHVPAIWWADAMLVSVMLLDASGVSPGRTDSDLFSFDAGAPAAHPMRNWPALLAAGYAGNYVGHILVGDPVPQALALSACAVADSAIAAYGLCCVLGGRVDLTRQKHLVQFVGFAVLLGPMVASLGTGLVLHLAAGVSPAVALQSFPPCALGMSVVPPLVLGLSRPETWDLFRTDRLMKTVVYLVAVAVGTALIFSRSEFALLFLVIPPLLFLVLRLGLSGGALGCCLVAGIGTDATISSERGPLSHVDPNLEHRILLLQLFLATAVLSVSVVGVVLAELKRAHDEVHESELRYRSLAATMEMLASIDPLTRVANRRRFDEVLQQEWQRGVRTRTPLSLILFDADCFKAYNDQYGHLAGDTCLRRIAEKMNGMARRPADLVARYGGEEFGLVLPETCAEGAIAWAERLRQSIEELAFTHPASPCGLVTVSGGCATMIPTPSMTPTDLLQAADAALYEAKRKGRNRIEAVYAGASVGRAG